MTERPTPIPAARDTQLPYDREQDARLSAIVERVNNEAARIDAELAALEARLEARTALATQAKERRPRVGLLLGALAVVIAVASIAVAAQAVFHRSALPSTVTQNCPEAPACPQCPACPRTPDCSCPPCPSFTLPTRSPR